MKKLILLSIALLSTSSVGFAGSISTMDKTAATNELSNKTITTISAVTLNGKVISDSFTGYFSKDGKMQGKLANKPDNDPQADQGTWKVMSDGTVCVTWQHWDNAKEKCVNFYKLSNALLIINKNRGFESLVLNSDMKSGNQM